jgi:hypothetical protein
MDNRNLIAALAIAALLTVAVTTAGCTTSTNPTPTPIAATQTSVGNNTTFSSAAGFNITYPKTLKIDSTTNASVQVRIYVYLATNNTIDAVNVATYDLNANATLEDFTAFNKGGINDYPNYQTISNNTTTFAGKPAYNIVWQATVPVQLNETAVKNTTLKVMQTYVINNNKGYVVTYKALPNDYDTYLAQAQRIMDSFVLT